MMNDTWSDRESTRALQLWNEGRSASDIAQRLRMEFGSVRTRNSVLGKSYRDRWPPHKKNPPYSRHHQVKGPAKPHKPKALVASPLPISPPKAESNPKTLFDLVDHECHWPLDGGLYCGAVCFGEYCEAHALERRGSRATSRGLKRSVLTAGWV